MIKFSDKTKKTLNRIMARGLLIISVTVILVILIIFSNIETETKVKKEDKAKQLKLEHIQSQLPDSSTFKQIGGNWLKVTVKTFNQDSSKFHLTSFLYLPGIDPVVVPINLTKEVP